MEWNEQRIHNQSLTQSLAPEFKKDVTVTPLSDTYEDR